MTADAPLDAEQVRRQVDYWLDLADYDLATARSMLVCGHLLYVGFMCHQVVEKALKGVYSARCQAVPPKIHALVQLALLSSLYDEMTEDQRELMLSLQPMNTESRYPAEKAKLLAALTTSGCAGLISETEEMFQWIKQKLLRV
jgi:HEPN domain-containing protein